MANSEPRTVLQILFIAATVVVASIFLVACVLPVVGISGLSCLGSSLDAKFDEAGAARNSTEIAIDAINSVEANR